MSIKKASQKSLEEEKDRLVTRGYLNSYIDSALAKYSREERTLLHEALLESLENAKAYHQTETERYIKALMEEWRSDTRAFHEYMQGIKATVDGHGERIDRLEAVIA